MSEKITSAQALLDSFDGGLSFETKNQGQKKVLEKLKKFEAVIFNDEGQVVDSKSTGVLIDLFTDSMSQTIAFRNLLEKGARDFNRQKIEAEALEEDGDFSFESLGFVEGVTHARALEILSNFDSYFNEILSRLVNQGFVDEDQLKKLGVTGVEISNIKASVGAQRKEELDAWIREDEGRGALEERHGELLALRTMLELPLPELETYNPQMLADLREALLNARAVSSGFSDYQREYLDLEYFSRAESRLEELVSLDEERKKVEAAAEKTKEFDKEVFLMESLLNQIPDGSKDVQVERNESKAESYKEFGDLLRELQRNLNGELVRLKEAGLLKTVTGPGAKEINDKVGAIEERRKRLERQLKEFIKLTEEPPVELMTRAEIVDECDALGWDPFIWKNMKYQQAGRMKQIVRAFLGFCFTEFKDPTGLMSKEEVAAAELDRIAQKVKMQLIAFDNFGIDESGAASVKIDELEPGLFKQRQAVRSEFLLATTYHPEWGADVREILDFIVMTGGLNEGEAVVLRDGERLEIDFTPGTDVKDVLEEGDRIVEKDDEKGKASIIRGGDKTHLRFDPYKDLREHLEPGDEIKARGGGEAFIFRGGARKEITFDPRKDLDEQLEVGDKVTRINFREGKAFIIRDKKQKTIKFNQFRELEEMIGFERGNDRVLYADAKDGEATVVLGGKKIKMLYDQDKGLNDALSEGDEVIYEYDPDFHYIPLANDKGRSVLSAKLQEKYGDVSPEAIFFAEKLYTSTDMLTVSLMQLQNKTQTRSHNGALDMVDLIMLYNPLAAYVHRSERYGFFAEDWFAWWMLYMRDITEDDVNLGRPPGTNEKGKKFDTSFLTHKQHQIKVSQRAFYDLDGVEGVMQPVGFCESVFPSTFDITELGDGEVLELPDGRCRTKDGYVDSKEVEETWEVVAHQDGGGSVHIPLDDGEDNNNSDVLDLDKRKKDKKSKMNVTSFTLYMVARAGWETMLEMTYDSIPAGVSFEVLTEELKEGGKGGYISRFVGSGLGRAKMYPGPHLDTALEPLLLHLIMRSFQAYKGRGKDPELRLFNAVMAGLAASGADTAGLGRFSRQLARIQERLKGDYLGAMSYILRKRDKGHRPEETTAWMDLHMNDNYDGKKPPISIRGYNPDFASKSSVDRNYLLVKRNLKDGVIPSPNTRRGKMAHLKEDEK